jgi:predicted dehydrogenase
VAHQRYGPLQLLEVEGRTALLWPGYDLVLDSVALDMMHADFDLVTGLLGAPETIQVVGTAGPAGGGSTATVILDYPRAIARCSSSALMPQPYGVRGGWRATFTGVVLEYAMRAGFTGHGPATLIEHTSDGAREIDLPSANPYAAMIDHVLACLADDAQNLIAPATALPALDLTLEVQHPTRSGSRVDRHTSTPLSAALLVV